MHCQFMPLVWNLALTTSGGLYAPTQSLFQSWLAPTFMWFWKHFSLRLTVLLSNNIYTSCALSMFWVPLLKGADHLGMWINCLYPGSNGTRESLSLTRDFPIELWSPSPWLTPLLASRLPLGSELILQGVWLPFVPTIVKSFQDICAPASWSSPLTFVRFLPSPVLALRTFDLKLWF